MQRPRRILILGGTTEARQLAGRLAGRPELDIVLSLAGRTVDPVRQPVPVRSGGFGGAEGLARHLEAEDIELLVDATHPYAAQISKNAAVAASSTGVPLIALRRPAWQPVEGDRWTEVEDAEAAVAALGAAPRRVFLALGRQEIGAFETASQHDYLIRSVDPVEPPLGVPSAEYILARGPFSEAAELVLLEEHRIDAIVAKNSGGSATYGKIAAARTLGIEVFLFRRPEPPAARTAEDVDEAVSAIDHWLAGASERGV
jgi:precorrin-6A/cobalt-precorrin-6A reductase